jgi:cell division protein FtsB
VLQYRLWVGDGSFAEVSALRREIRAQRDDIDRMKRRNQALQAEVDDLRRGLDAIEGRARSELGMIREGEIFYQIPESPQKAPP